MPTVTQIVTIIAPISNYYVSDDIANGALFGAAVNPMLGQQLYIETQAVRNRYDYENIAGGATPSQSLVLAANYLYGLCGQPGLYALSLANSGGVIPDTDNGDSFAPKHYLIGVAGRGRPDDPVAGLGYFQSNKLIGLGSTNNGQIEITIGVTVQWNFGDNKSFDFNMTTGTIYLRFGNTFQGGVGLSVDLNQ